jgi:capsular polysaccharide biosynthesis protein
MLVILLVGVVITILCAVFPAILSGRISQQEERLNDKLLDDLRHGRGFDHDA